MNTLKIKKLHPDAIIPTRAHATDAGLDLYASESAIVTNGTKISTGIAVDIPAGYEGTIRPRSGLTTRSRVRVQLGTVDAGYNGEIKIIADYVNNIEFDGKKSHLHEKGYKVFQGDKIAQLVITPIVTPAVEVVDDFDTQSERGSNGFGSTDEVLP